MNLRDNDDLAPGEQESSARASEPDDLQTCVSEVVDARERSGGSVQSGSAKRRSSPLFAGPADSSSSTPHSSPDPLTEAFHRSALASSGRGTTGGATVAAGSPVASEDRKFLNSGASSGTGAQLRLGLPPHRDTIISSTSNTTRTTSGNAVNDASFNAIEVNSYSSFSSHDGGGRGGGGVLISRSRLCSLDEGGMLRASPKVLPRPTPVVVSVPPPSLSVDDGGGVTSGTWGGGNNSPLSDRRLDPLMATAKRSTDKDGDDSNGRYQLDINSPSDAAGELPPQDRDANVSGHPQPWTVKDGSINGEASSQPPATESDTTAPPVATLPDPSSSSTLHSVGTPLSILRSPLGYQSNLLGKSATSQSIPLSSFGGDAEERSSLLSGSANLLPEVRRTDNSNTVTTPRSSTHNNNKRQDTDDVGRYYEREYGVPDDPVPPRRSSYAGDDPQLDALFSTISEHAVSTSSKIFASVTNSSLATQRNNTPRHTNGSNAGSPKDVPHRGVLRRQNSASPAGAGGVGVGGRRRPSIVTPIGSGGVGSGGAVKGRGGVVSPPAVATAGIPTPNMSFSESASLSPRLGENGLQLHLPPNGESPLPATTDVIITGRVQLMGNPQTHRSGSSGQSSPSIGALRQSNSFGNKSQSDSRGGSLSQNNTSGTRRIISPQQKFQKAPSSRRRSKSSLAAVASPIRVEEVFSAEHQNVYTVAVEVKSSGRRNHSSNRSSASAGSTTRVYYNKGKQPTNIHSATATSTTTLEAGSNNRRGTLSSMLGAADGMSIASSGVIMMGSEPPTLGSSPIDGAFPIGGRGGASRGYGAGGGAFDDDPLSEGDSGQSSGSEGWVKLERLRQERAQDRRVKYLKAAPPVQCILFVMWSFFSCVGAVLSRIGGRRMRSCCFRARNDEGRAVPLSTEEQHHQRRRQHESGMGTERWDNDSTPQCVCIFMLHCVCCCGDAVYEPDQEDAFGGASGGGLAVNTGEIDEGDIEADKSQDDGHNQQRRRRKRRGSPLAGQERRAHSPHSQIHTPWRHRINILPTQEGLGSFYDDEDDEELLDIDVVGRHFGPGSSFVVRGGGSPLTATPLEEEDTDDDFGDVTNSRGGGAIVSPRAERDGHHRSQRPTHHVISPRLMQPPPIHHHHNDDNGPSTTAPGTYGSGAHLHHPHPRAHRKFRADAIPPSVAVSTSKTAEDQHGRLRSTNDAVGSNVPSPSRSTPQSEDDQRSVKTDNVGREEETDPMVMLGLFAPLASESAFMPTHAPHTRFFSGAGDVFGSSSKDTLISVSQSGDPLSSRATIHSSAKKSTSSSLFAMLGGGGDDVKSAVDDASGPGDGQQTIQSTTSEGDHRPPPIVADELSGIHPNAPHT